MRVMEGMQVYRAKLHGAAVPITNDHKPELTAERRRIESLGGFVSYIGCWRAMGILAMSRAIGDLFLKPYVSAEPEVSVVPVGASDEFVVLGSDGLWDVIGKPEAASRVRAWRAEHGSIDGVAEALAAV